MCLTYGNTFKTVGKGLKVEMKDGKHCQRKTLDYIFKLIKRGGFKKLDCQLQGYFSHKLYESIENVFWYP